MRTSGKGTDTATTLELEKSRRIDFSLGRWPTRGKKRPNWWGNMPVEPWDLSEFFSIHFCGRGSHFPQGNFFVAEKGTNLEFSDSVLVFVRWIIWHQAKGYNWNIMSQILSFLTHITALAVGSITSSHSKISAICWYHFFVWILIPLDGAVIDGDMLSIVLSTFLARSY